MRSNIAPGPPALPLLGHLLRYLPDKLGFLSRCAADYGPIVKLNMGCRTYLLNDPEDVRHVLETNHSNYEKSPRMTSRRGRRLSGSGLLTSKGEAHLVQRRMMQPSFHQAAIAGFADAVVSTTQYMLKDWGDGGERDVAAEMMRLVQRILGRVLFSLDYPTDAPELARALETRRRYIRYHYRSLFPWPEILPNRMNREYRRARRLIDQEIYRVIRERRRSGTPSADLLSMLMRAKYRDGAVMSDAQLRDEALILSITGYETTGEALAWTLYLLAQHPDVERRLFSEWRSVLEGRLPDLSELGKLHYTEMVLSESMRLYPPTWIYVRVSKRPDRLPSGVQIGAREKLYLCPYVMHRNPRYFPDPDRFDPLRFDQSAIKSRPRYAYFPFGGGARVCIGQAFAMMEGLLVLPCILQRFKFTLVPGQKIVPEPSITLYPRNGIRMQLVPRET